MTQTIHFKTSIFDVSAEKENPINPIYGISLLEWLRAELHGQVDLTEPEAEDWGWYSEAKFEGGYYLVGASAIFDEGDDPSLEIEWVVQVDKHRSLKEKLLGRNRMNSSDKCFVFLKELLQRQPRIKGLQVG